MTTTAPVFNAWLDDFFDSYYRHRPINATYIGEHRYDQQLPDMTQAGVDECLAGMDGLLKRLQSLPPESLTATEWIDRTLAEGFLHIQTWEYTSEHFQRGNPSFYSGEAVFSVMALFLTNYAPLSERVAAATERMLKIPAFLEQGKSNVRRAPIAWTERALRECRGALAFFADGVDQLMGDEGFDDDHFRAAADGAAAAFAGFREYLNSELLGKPSDGYACGAEAFDLMMRQGHFIDQDAAELVAYAEDALAEADAYLAEHAADFGAADVAQALLQLADLHPTADDYARRYMELWEACRQRAVDHNLLTWPDFPIEYVERPLWARAAAPDLYFLFYRSPAAIARPPIHRYLVAPLDETLTPSEQERFLRDNNDSVIKLNHVVHHGSIGHHVQNWHAFRSPSRFGRMAAVDCASRIAMFCGGTMAEGWACYATHLMGEAGFLTPLESYAEVQSRRRMSARAIVDVKLHSGEFSLDEAAAFYQQRAMMGAAAAKGEAVKNSMFPAAAMMYLFGMDRIHEFRGEMSARQGSDFDLAHFHDRFLSYGSIPVPLICASMRREADDAT